MRRPLGLAGLAALLLAGAPLDARAQDRSWAIAGELSGLLARQVVEDAGPLSGGWVGAAVEGRWRGVALLVGSHTGTIRSADGAAERRVRLTDVSLRVRVRPWLALGMDADALRSTEEGETSLWRMAGPAVHVTAPLGIDGVTARADVAYFPINSVAGFDALAPGARGEVGMEFASPRFPASVRIAFRRQTFRFADGRAPEALGGLVLSARARLLGS